MSCAGTSDCGCGCCAGTSIQTPVTILNRPGLPAISYRVGTWAVFKDSMLARLSSSEYPALAGLKTRENDDPTIALLDATSIVLDILTFYQERLANESYRRTAARQASLIELSKLIGYRPAPEVAAATYVAFTLKTTPGQTPDPDTPSITIPAGTQMQSVPAQDETPQIFETSADVEAKADWNALPVLYQAGWSPGKEDTSLYLLGTATQLQPGDRILIVGDERKKSGQETWDLCEITTVVVDGTNGRTYVEWHEPLKDPPAQEHPRFHAFRQRAALFGYNAVSPVLLYNSTTSDLTPLIANTEWIFTATPVGPLIDLDTVYAKVVSDSWIALIKPDDTGSPGDPSLYLVGSVASISRTAYGVSGRITRATVDREDLSPYYEHTRDTVALVQSEELTVAPQPLRYPLYGSSLELQDLRLDLAGVAVVAVTGKRQKVGLNDTTTFIPDDGSTPKTLDEGAVVTITDGSPLASIAAADWDTQSGTVTLSVEDDTGRSGTIVVGLRELSLTPAGDKDPYVGECVLVSSVDNSGDHTVLTLAAPLEHCYERTKATTVNANVVEATHGQTVSELLGNGSAATPNQTFTLKQSPLTYVQAPTTNGRQSTLTIEVSGVKWEDVETLYGQKPAAAVFTSVGQPDEQTDVQFGDGVEGSTLPTGQSNLQATYRIGSGAAGNVAAGTLTTLVDRPLGVSGVTNPQSATGGEDGESIDDIRVNAPQTVLTLGRAVSIADYQSYASTFSGIAKAHALWIPSGPGRGVFLTVAGADGQALSASSITLDNLVTSLTTFGNPLTPVRVQSFLETFFRFSAVVRYDPAHDQEEVQAQVQESVTSTYRFANRTFGQGVSVDGITSVIQEVPGVVAVNVTGLTLGKTSAAGDLAGSDGTFTVPELNAWLAQQITLLRPDAGSPTRICAYLPIPSLTSVPQPAEILVLDPDPNAVTLKVWEEVS